MVPQTFVFPEFIHWLDSSLYPQNIFAMDKLGENILQVSFVLIQQALCFPSSNSYTPFSEETLFSTFQELSGSTHAQTYLVLMPVRKHLPLEPSHFPMDTFIE